MEDQWKLRRKDRWKAPIEVMNKSVLKTVAWSCVRPFQLLFFEQMCLNLCLLSAILLGVLYLFLLQVDMLSHLATIISILFIVVFRIIVVRYKLALPKFY